MEGKGEAYDDADGEEKLNAIDNYWRKNGFIPEVNLYGSLALPL